SRWRRSADNRSALRSTVDVRVPPLPHTDIRKRSARPVRQPSEVSSGHVAESIATDTNDFVGRFRTRFRVVDSRIAVISTIKTPKVLGVYFTIVHVTEQFIRLSPCGRVFDRIVQCVDVVRQTAHQLFPRTVDDLNTCEFRSKKTLVKYSECYSTTEYRFCKEAV